MTEETLFKEALAKSPAGRTAFPDAARAAQPQLRVAVEALFAAHDESGNILDKPPAELAQSFHPAPGQPTATDYCPNAEAGLIIGGLNPGPSQSELLMIPSIDRRVATVALD